MKLKENFLILGLLITSLVGGVAACGSNRSVDDGSGGAIHVSEDPLTFVGTEIGQETVKTFSIQNVSPDGTLKIMGLQLFEESNNDNDGQEFFKGDLWIQEPTLLQSGESLDVSIAYRPLDTQQDNGRLRIRVQGDPNLTDGYMDVPLVSEDISYQLNTENPMTFSGLITESQWSCKDVRVSNIGLADYKLATALLNDRDQYFRVLYYKDKPEDGLCSSEDGGEVIHDYKEGETINNIIEGLQGHVPSQEIGVVKGGGGGFYIRYFFVPASRESANAFVSLFDHKNEQYRIDISANRAEKCLEVVPTPINFGKVLVNFPTRTTIKLRNCNPDRNGESLTVSGLLVESKAREADGEKTFSLSDTNNPTYEKILAGEKLSILPGNSVSVDITFNPDDLQSFVGKLIIESDDPSSPSKEIGLLGEGTEQRNPVARANARVEKDAKEGSNKLVVVPQTTIYLDGSDSFDPDKGSIVEYEWKVIKEPNRPANAATNLQFQPNNTVKNPSVRLDSAGEYLFQLVVKDNDGNTSGNEPTSRVLIEVRPDSDIHIQLVWTTSQVGSSETPKEKTTGADADLYVAFGNAGWEDQNFTVFHKSKVVSINNTSKGKMSLDLDDQDGDGPENINIGSPRNGDIFDVGVNYFTSNGWGPIYATVRIYIQGELRYQTVGTPPRAYLTDGQFWDVARITWNQYQGKNSTTIKTTNRIFKNINDANIGRGRR